MARISNHKSSIFDLDANVVSLIMYASIAILGFSPGANLLTFAIPIIVYGVEKKSEYVKKNAIQALTISLIATGLYLIFTIISFVMEPRCTADLVCFGSSIIHKAFGFYGSLRWMVAAFVFIVCLLVAIRSYNYEDAELNELSKFNQKAKKILDKTLKTSKNVDKSNEIKPKKDSLSNKSVQPTINKKKTPTSKKTVKKKPKKVVDNGK